MIRLALALIVALSLAPESNAQTAAQFVQLRQYVTELALARERDKADLLALEHYVEAQRVAINNLLDVIRNLHCNYNGTMQAFAAGVAANKTSVPAITYDPDDSKWVSCLDRTKPAPRLPTTNLPPPPP